MGDKEKKLDRSRVLQDRFQYILDDEKFGRATDREVLSRLLLAAHMYALEAAQEMNKELMATISRPIIVCTDQETADKLLAEIKKKES